MLACAPWRRCTTPAACDSSASAINTVHGFKRPSRKLESNPPFYKPIYRESVTTSSFASFAKRMTSCINSGPSPLTATHSSMSPRVAASREVRPTEKGTPPEPLSRRRRRRTVRPRAGVVRWLQQGQGIVLSGTTDPTHMAQDLDVFLNEGDFALTTRRWMRSKPRSSAEKDEEEEDEEDGRPSGGTGGRRRRGNFSSYMIRSLMVTPSINYVTIWGGFYITLVSELSIL